MQEICTYEYVHVIYQMNSPHFRSIIGITDDITCFWAERNVISNARIGEKALAKVISDWPLSACCSHVSTKVIGCAQISFGGSKLREFREYDVCRFSQSSV